MSNAKADFKFVLTINPETVRDIIEKARAISANLSDEYEGGHEHEVEFDGYNKDIHQHSGLAEEETADMSDTQLQQLIDGLNEDKASELVAITWIGRGDFEIGEWEKTVETARRSATAKTSTYLMGMPMLGDWLDEGLAAIGV